MQVSLAYGRGRLTVEVPDHAVVIAPQELPGLPDERAAFEAAVRAPIASAPLSELATPDSTVCIVIADITRPSPSERLVPWILRELSHVPRANFVILNGTGTHRPNTRPELIQMLGREVVETLRIVNHDAFDSSGLSHLGRTSFGGEVWINNEWLRADVRIVTGFIEPHFFAGFSGGPKGVVPGVSGIETIMHLHNAPMIAHPHSTWARLEENPVPGFCAPGSMAGANAFVGRAQSRDVPLFFARRRNRVRLSLEADASHRSDAFRTTEAAWAASARHRAARRPPKRADAAC